MQLAEIPQIITLLEQGAGENFPPVITAEQKSAILAEMDSFKQTGKKAFAGETAVEMGFVGQETLDKYLLQQSVLKLDAVFTDIQTIVQEGAQEHPPFLKANWGNNGVNPYVKKPDASSAVAAGIADLVSLVQNTLMVFNELAKDGEKLTPRRAEIVSEALQCARDTASQMIHGIAGGSKLIDAERAANKVGAALRVVAKVSEYQPKDANGAIIDLDKFIEERMKGVNAGLMASLENAPQSFDQKTASLLMHAAYVSEEMREMEGHTNRQHLSTDMFKLLLALKKEPQERDFVEKEIIKRQASFVENIVSDLEIISQDEGLQESSLLRYHEFGLDNPRELLNNLKTAVNELSQRSGVPTQQALAA